MVETSTALIFPFLDSHNLRWPNSTQLIQKAIRFQKAVVVTHFELVGHGGAKLSVIEGLSYRFGGILYVMYRLYVSAVLAHRALAGAKFDRGTPELPPRIRVVSGRGANVRHLEFSQILHLKTKV